MKHMLALPHTIFSIPQKLVPLLIALPFCFACSSSRYVPEGDYLLGRNRIIVTESKVNRSEFNRYMLQSPNKKWIFGLRVNLFIYNLSNINKGNWFHKWLRKIGEPPVIYDEDLVAQTSMQFKKYLENKGYYYAQVSDSTMFPRSKASITYTITPGEPYRVRQLHYTFEDTGLVRHILNDTVNSLLRRGMLFDKERLQMERVRLEKRLKEMGFYHFSKEYIYFDADLIPDDLYVDLTMSFTEFTEGEHDYRTKVKHHPRYQISHVVINPDFSIPQAGIHGGAHKDTIAYNHFQFLSRGPLKIKPSVVAGRTYILPGNLYSADDVDRTYRALNGLDIFRFTNIQFYETPGSIKTDKGFYPLYTHIELTRNKVHSFTIEPLLTNSAGDMGAKSNVMYQNFNFFRGAEVFNTRLTGAFEVLKDSLYTSTIEYGAEVRLEIPRFWLPFRSEQFVKRYNPRTTLSYAINHRTDNQYVRTYSNAAFGYTWRGNRFLRHSIFPFEMNFVQVNEERSRSFLSSIKGTRLEAAFTDQLISASRYTLEYNTQEIGRIKDFTFFRMNAEIAGSVLYSYSAFTDREQVKDSYQLFHSPFAQYIKSDIDFRYFSSIDVRNSIVYRVFAGFGKPYANSRTMPFEKKYFAGGQNSLRAWRAYSIGPGSFRDTAFSRYAQYRNLGDIKLEVNMEYRFKMFWKLEGALFADAGNIWDFASAEVPEEGIFRFDKFLNQLALASGFGARFDFSFFILRFDVGLKMYDPGRVEGSRWFPYDPERRFDIFALQYGIGYPF